MTSVDPDLFEMVAGQMLGTATGAVQAIAVGTSYAAKVAFDEYGVEDLTDYRIPEALRTFIENANAAGAEYIDATLGALELD